MSAALGNRTANGAESAETPATLGQWLDARIPKFDAASDRPEALTGSGETRRVVDALERLARRVEAQERRGAMGAAAIDRALDDVANRVGTIEDTQTETSGRLFEALLGLERVHGGLADRLAALEVDGVRHKAFARLEDRAGALEAHLTQVRTLTSREIEGLREGISRLGQAAQESIEDLTLRLESARYAPAESVDAMQSEAALLRKAFSSFQAETNARLQGIAAEAGSASELASLRAQFLVSSERFDATLARLTNRLEALAAESTPRANLEESARVVSAALAAMSARLDGQDSAFSRKADVEQVLGGLATRLETLGSKLESAHGVLAEQEKKAASDREEMDGAIVDLRARIEASAARAEAISEAARAAAHERCEVIARVAERRIEEVESRSAASVSTLEEAQGLLEERVRALGEARLAEETARLQEEFAARSEALTGEMQAAISTAREEFERRLAQTAAAIETGALATGLSEALSQIHQFGKSQDVLAETISVELKRWNESQDRRLRGIEARIDDSVSATARLEGRFASLEADSLGAASHTHEALSALSARIEERAAAGERRAGQALEDVGAQIIELADRMDHRQRLLLQDLEARLADFERRSNAAAEERQAMLEARLATLNAQPNEPALRGALDPLSAEQARTRAIPESISVPARRPEQAEPIEGDSQGDAGDDAGDEEIPTPAFLIRSDVELEDHFIDDYAEAAPPRYDLVDALDAVISRDSSRRLAVPEAQDPIDALLAPRNVEEEGPASAPAPLAVLPEPHWEISQGDEIADDEPMPMMAIDEDSDMLDPVDVLLAHAVGRDEAPLILGPQDADAITLTSAMRVERAPAVSSDTMEELFNSPFADAAAQGRNPREPSYLAAARRATQVNAEQANAQRNKSNAPTLTRALFWAATAVAIGAGVYAVSRESGGGEKAHKPTQPRADGEGLRDANATREAALRTLEGAAQHLDFGETFEARPVELPEEGVSADTALITPSQSAIPLAPPEA